MESESGKWTASDSANYPQPPESLLDHLPGHRWEEKTQLGAFRVSGPSSDSWV